MSFIIKFIETESRMVVARRCDRKGNSELLMNMCGVSIREDEKFWNWMVVLMYHVNVPNVIELCT